MNCPPIVHHTLLRSSGGATRVAEMLHAALRQRGVHSSRTWELDEREAGHKSPGLDQAVAAWRPVLEKGGILHLHSSHDWTTTLRVVLALHQEFASFGSENLFRIVLTLHDCSLLTGGCVYPLDCPSHFAGCPDPCPRGFPESARRKDELRELLEACNPLLVSPSGWLKNMARSHVSGLDTRVVPNGVEWPESSTLGGLGGKQAKEAARKAVGVGLDARMVLFVAHGGEKAVYKGGEYWRTICTGIRNAVPGALFFLVGGDRHDVEGDLIHWPYLDGERLHTLMLAADVLAYPTLADNHPLVVLEAMAAQCPVVAWNTGGLPEQIMHGQTGLLAPYRDISGFIESCIYLLSHPAKAARMGSEAFVEGGKRFTVQRMADDYLRIYKKFV